MPQQFCPACTSAVVPGRKLCMSCGTEIQDAQTVFGESNSLYEPDGVMAIDSYAKDFSQRPRHAKTMNRRPQWRKTRLRGRKPSKGLANHFALASRAEQYADPAPILDFQLLLQPSGTVQNPFADAKPAGRETKPRRAAMILLNLLLMNIPIVGFALSVIWGLNRVDSDKRDLARAMIVVSAIWHAVFVVNFLL